MQPLRQSWNVKSLAMLLAVAIGLGMLGHGLSAEGVDAELLKSFTFRALGPTTTGGRIVDIAVNPLNKHVIYAAGASGGLWKSVNRGTTWDCIFQYEGTLSIGDIALDPKKPDTIWVGSGEANNQRSAFWGDGIYKSTDGGKTWVNTGLRESHHIGRIVVHPGNTNCVYVAALGHLYTPNKERGLYKTTNGGRSWEKVLYINPDVGVVDVVLHPKNPEIVYAASYERRRRAWHFDGAGPGSGIYKSTNGGRDWTRLQGGLPEGEIGRIGLAVCPKEPEWIFAAVSDQNLKPPQAPKAPEKDDKKKGKNKKAKAAGENDLETPFGFQLTFDETGCRVLAVDKGSPAARQDIKAGDKVTHFAGQAVDNPWDLLAVMISLRPGDRVLIGIDRKGAPRTVSMQYPVPAEQQVGGGVFVSRDGGLKWEKRNDKPVGGTPAYYYGQIRVDPQDPQRIYVLSVPLYSTADGGKTWATNTARSVHVDHHALWINPTDSSHILLGNDGGMHVSYDGAATWDYIFNLPLTQFYAVGADMQKPYHVYGGTQDNGTFGGPSLSRNRRGISRFEWYKVGFGDGFYTLVDPEDTDTIYCEWQFGHPMRFDRKTGGRKSIRPPQSDPAGPRDRYNWNSPILISHHNPKTIYFAGNRLFKSYNRGDDWQVISPDLTTADPGKLIGNVPHCTITTVAESPLDAKVLLVGTDDGNVQWSDDGGKTWTNLRGRFPLAPPLWWVTRVELSRHDINTAYVSFSAFREDDFRPFVFATRDRGKTWQSIIDNLPNEPVNVIKEDPVNPELLFVGTEFGVFCSITKGGAWLPLGEKKLPRVSVQDLLVHPRDKDLIIGTHGRGFFIMDVSPFQEMTPNLFEKKVHLFAVKNTVRWRSQYIHTISGDRRVISPNPPYGATISYYLKEAVKPEEIALTVEDMSGKTLHTLKPVCEAGIHRLQWDLRGEPNRGRQSGPGDSAVRHYRAVLKVRGETFTTPVMVERDPLDG